MAGVSDFLDFLEAGPRDASCVFNPWRDHDEEAIDEHQARAGSRRWIDELSALWRAQAFLPAAAGKFSASA